MDKRVIVFLAAVFIPVLAVIIIIIAGFGAYTKSGVDNGIGTHLTLLKLLFFGVPAGLIGLYYAYRNKDENLAKGYCWAGIFWIGLYFTFFLLWWLPPFLFNQQIERKYRQDVKEGRYQRRAFREFAGKFDKITLPYTYRLTTKTGGNISKLALLDKNSPDTQFIKTPFPDDTFCLGMISDTSNFYALIYFFPGYYYYPVLATYTKTGRFINQKPLTVTSCDSTCGLRYCSQTVELGPDFSIKSIDSIYFNTDCRDKTAPPKPAGLLKQVSLLGRVTKAGVIELKKDRRLETTNLNFR